jgi:hypothetical protein
MIDDNQKVFIPNLAIDNDFFYSAFVNPCMIKKTKCAVRAVRDGAIALKGSHTMGDWRIFLKSLSDASFNKDLSNEPTFGRIHLAGHELFKYLEKRGNYCIKNRP